MKTPGCLPMAVGTIVFSGIGIWFYERGQTSMAGIFGLLVLLALVLGVRSQQ